MSTSIFFVLPPELRIIIYRELLLVTQMISRTPLPPHILDGIGFREKSLDVAILQVCRMIRNEAIPILYGENRFISSSFYREPESFLHDIGERNASHIKYVQINILVDGTKARPSEACPCDPQFLLIVGKDTAQYYCNLRTICLGAFGVVGPPSYKVYTPSPLEIVSIDRRLRSTFPQLEQVLILDDDSPDFPGAAFISQGWKIISPERGSDLLYLGSV